MAGLGPSGVPPSALASELTRWRAACVNPRGYDGGRSDVQRAIASLAGRSVAAPETYRDMAVRLFVAAGGGTGLLGAVALDLHAVPAGAGLPVAYDLSDAGDEIRSRLKSVVQSFQTSDGGDAFYGAQISQLLCCAALAAS